MAPKSTPTIVLDCGWKVSLYASIKNQLLFFNIFHWYAVNRFFIFFKKFCCVEGSRDDCSVRVLQRIDCAWGHDMAATYNAMTKKQLK